MSKTTPEDRVAALERELQLTREQHAAEIQALRDDIRAANQQSRGNGTDFTDQLMHRLEQTDPRVINAEERARIDRLHQDIDERMLAPYRDLLGQEGQPLFAAGTLGWDREGERERGVPPVPRNTQGRVVGAQNHYECQAKYVAHMGINPHHYMGAFFDGVSFTAYPLSDEDAAQARAEILALIAKCPDTTQLITLSHKWFVKAHNAACVAVREPAGVS